MGGSSPGNIDIYVVTLVQGYPTVNVTNHPAKDVHFSWSPSGNQLAFVSNRSGSEELWVVDSNGANATQLTSDGGSKHSTAWSPKGRWIAYVRNGDIWVYDLKFASSKNLTMGNGENIEPCWSPSGTQIVFVSDRSGNWDIWVMDASGANLTQLTNTPQEERRPVWSPNGQKIAFERGTIQARCRSRATRSIWRLRARGFSRCCCPTARSPTRATAGSKWTRRAGS
jgi:TolB protein